MDITDELKINGIYIDKKADIVYQVLNFCGLSGYEIFILKGNYLFEENRKYNINSYYEDKYLGEGSKIIKILFGGS